MGLVKGHYFIHDCTELTSYCLKKTKKSKILKIVRRSLRDITINIKKCNDRFVKAFQVFKMLVDTGDKLIVPMELPDGVLNTQICDKFDDYKTLDYNERNCRSEGYG